jgi:Cu-Zn family superoxide dismutase
MRAASVFAAAGSPASWAALATIAALAGCAATTPASAPTAVAQLQPTQGNSATGEVRFVQQGARLAVTAQVGGLKPNQEHGFHVHEKGDCSSPDATSAGGHFNPDGKPHGAPGAPHHAGDLPSLKADAQGRAQTSFTIDGALAGDPGTSFAGKAVVVHAMPDDYTSQPAGNSGARIACGVIRMP